MVVAGSGSIRGSAWSAVSSAVARHVAGMSGAGSSAPASHATPKTIAAPANERKLRARLPQVSDGPISNGRYPARLAPAIGRRLRCLSEDADKKTPALKAGASCRGKAELHDVRHLSPDRLHRLALDLADPLGGHAVLVR